MTEHEHGFYKILDEALGRDYYIIAQAHLSTFLTENVKGQNWKAAFRHINGKSVDFLLCDKQTLEPLLTIELDDKTHEQSGRILRDAEVERILASAHIPLIRMQSHGEIHTPDFQKLVQATIL
jgi:very-short-patch-repair endonuclease